MLEGDSNQNGFPVEIAEDLPVDDLFFFGPFSR